MASYRRQGNSSEAVYRNQTRSELDRADVDLQDDLQLLNQRHEKYFLRTLGVLPHTCVSYESHRASFIFFAVSGLDVLGAIDKHFSQKDKEDMIEFLYRLQVPASKDKSKFRHGFRGGTFIPRASSDSDSNGGLDYMDGGHITMTYSALATLVILGDDLSRVDRSSIMDGIQKLQQPDGSFIATVEEDTENDMRFVYCACTICYILDDWSGMDVEKTVHFIKSSIAYDGGIGQRPGVEGHGGHTYCALASLALMGRQDALSKPQKLKVLRWCVFRLHQGFQGRPNKMDDTCYTWWLGAALRLLTQCLTSEASESEHLTRQFGSLCAKCHKFALNTQDPITGGFAKWPSSLSASPDPLHTYLGLSGMALWPGFHPSLSPTNAALNITERAHQRLKEIHVNRLK